MRQDAPIRRHRVLGFGFAPTLAGIPGDAALGLTPHDAWLGPTDADTPPDPRHDRRDRRDDDRSPLVRVGQGDDARELTPTALDDAMTGLGLAIARGLAGLGVLVIVLAVCSLLAGCTAPTAMQGPSTDASHETRPATRERVVELRIGGDKPAGTPAAAPAEPDDFSPVGPVSGAESSGAGTLDPAPFAATLTGSNTAILHALVAAATAYTPDDQDLIDRALHAAEQGRDVTLTIRETETGDSQTSTLNQRGPQLTTEHAEVAGAFDASGGEAEMPYRTSGSVSLGRTKIRAELASGAGVNALHVLGALAVIGAGVVFWLTRDAVLSLGFGAAGVGLIVLGTMNETAPWVLVLIGLGAIVVVAAAVYAAWRKRSLGETLVPIVSAVEANPHVKPDIAMSAGPSIGRVRREVRRIKTRLETSPAREAGSRER